VERYPSDAARLGVDPGEPAAWRAIAARIVTMKDPATGLIEQFAGFHSLELVDLAQFTPRTAPIDALLGRARTQRSQVVKQADVVELVALLWNDLTPEERRINFVHYEPRTAHGSSLSPGVHALVAAKLGLDATALRYFDQTADIDLGNTMGNAAGGVHAAALGSLWQAVVFGVAGVQPAPDDEDALLVAPRLLTGWRHVGLPFLWRGRALDIHVEPGSIEVGVEPGGKAPLPLRNAEEAGHRVLAEPGKRYGPWEEIRG
jgi:kojibiose phosphorylase